MIQPGIHPNLSNEEYHADPAISRSGILKFMESPYKYWAEYLNPERPPKSQTDEMAFGSAFHKFVLEYLDFFQDYVVEPQTQRLPKIVRLKDVGRPAFDAYKAEKVKIEFFNQTLMNEFDPAGRTVLTQKEMELLGKMHEKINAHSQARDLISNAKIEHSLFWRDKETGLMLKARPDIWHPNMVVDLKTCKSAATRPFLYAMIDGGYHIQAAMIQEGIYELEGKDISNFLNLCQEKTYPYSIGIKIIGESFLQRGREIFRETLKEMKLAIENNFFPDYSPETVELPAWY
jgi:hypothetical protein